MKTSLEKKYYRFLFVPLILILNVLVVSGQPANADCSGAFQIPDPIDWCSETTEFTNVDAGNSGYGAATCWTNSSDDVWFRFTSFATAVNIVVSGVAGGGTLNNPEVALYVDNCGGVISELECGSDGPGNGIINIFQGGMIIGQSYLIRVDGRGSNTGNFQLCINNFNPPVEPGQDCNTKSVICDKSPFVVQSVSGAGNVQDEAAGSCLGSGNLLSEQQSTWFSWTAANNGTLTFVLSPLNVTDDIDFVLYELPGGLDDCANKTILRCMATACQGPTGLDMTSTDLEEDLNCNPGEDGFVRFVDLVQGRSYALMVNNFSNTGIGFGIEFGGTSEFLGPEPNFMIDPPSGLKCDEVFTASDFSTFTNGTITNWDWSFGEGSIPQNAGTVGPHDIEYESFGQKFIALTIETDLGCIVTEVEEIYVEPCCEDTTEIDINLTDIQDLICAGVPSGIISVAGSGGFPDYQFSIDGNDFTPSPDFVNLFGGDHQVNIIDLKGCTDSIVVVIDEPAPLLVDAGQDVTVDLGFPAELEGTYSPFDPNTITDWFPPEGLDCPECLQITVVAPGTTTYILTAIDEMGCIGMDTVTVYVNLERPVYAPNIFTPNGDGINDFFTIFAGPAADEIEELFIFDRWGNKVYEGFSLGSNDTNDGWDGSFRGRDLNPGVYVWIARVRFVDNESQFFSGDITLMR
jgi:gliding motility-associated-like protein